MILLAVLFAVILCAIGGTLAWRSYGNRVEQVEARMLSNASEAARLVDQYFDDRIAILEALREMPSFREADPEVLEPLLSVLAAGDLGFEGGVGWANAEGDLVVSATLDDALIPDDLEEREDTAAVLQTRLPHVGAARQGADGSMLIPVAVPAYGRDGTVNGVIIGGVRAETMVAGIPALAPPSVDLRVVDRSGEMILHNGAPTVLEPPVNHSLLELETPVVVAGDGLRGDRDRITAIDRAETAGWVVVAEQSRASALETARSQLVGEAAVLAAFTLVTLGAALYAAQRLDHSHREMIRGARDLGAMEVLSERLSTATDTPGVARSAIDVLKEVFGARAVVVGLAQPDRGEMRVFIDGNGITEYTVPLDSPSMLNEALESENLLVVDQATLLETYPETDPVESEGPSGVLAGRFVGAVARGAVGIFLEEGFPPAAADIELFESMVPMLGDPFGRAMAAERERHLSRTFQEALLPQDSLGIDIPLQRAVRYQPAVGDVEIGGDWYDLWMIDEHRVGIVVGDVVGKGVAAAAAMGQLRSAVRAAVGAATNPTDALGYVDALTQQITGSAGATVLLGVLDLRNGSVRLASAGHLPPMVAGSGGVRVLWEMGGTPLGYFASSGSRKGVTVKLDPEDTLVLYSDGLIERRDEIIDEGIDRAAKVLAEHRDLPVEALADTLLDHMAIPDNPDDVALVCVRLVNDPSRHFTGVVPVSDYGLLHGRLAEWLGRTGGLRAEETASRVEEAVVAVSGVLGPKAKGELMVEVAPQGERLAVLVEYRKRPGEMASGRDRRILRAWGGGEMGPRGPRLSFVV